MKVVMDTNFMMLPNQFGIDIYEFLKYHQLCTMSSCMRELERIAKKKTKEGKAAKIAIELAKSNGVKIIESSGKTDSAVIDYAVQNKTAVATNDKEMIAYLKKNGVKVIRLKQKKYLVEE